MITGNDVIEKDTAVTVRYWQKVNDVESHKARRIPEPNGIAEFEKELSEYYVSVVQGRPAGAGGLVSLLVDVVTSTTLRDLVAALIFGAVYDLTKVGAKKLVLEPLLKAVKKLQSKNPEMDLDISELKITFRDAILHVDVIPPEKLTDRLDEILMKLAENFGSLALPSGELPFEIFIPILEDPAADRLIRFRQVLTVDETIKLFNSEMYFEYWGVEYDFGTHLEMPCVFDVHHKTILEENFWTRETYWNEWERRWAKEYYQKNAG